MAMQSATAVFYGSVQPAPRREGPSRGGARRLAWGVEGSRDRRAGTLEPLLRLAIEELRDLECEAARREIGLGGGIGQARGLQAGGDAIAERLAERDEALRGHFLRADLDQEIVARHASEEGSDPSFARSKGKPCASRLA